MKVTDTYWFTPGVGHAIGVVLGIDEITSKHKAYIGTVPHGGIEEADTRKIAESGAKVSKQTLLEIAGKL